MRYAVGQRPEVTRARPQPLRTRPAISVVVPCYKYGHYLPGCVASALDQDGVDVDVLVIDDASPDGSLAVARRLAAADTRISVVAHETNRGHLATYNEGLAAATGDYLVLLSADDLLAPGALGRAAALMEHHPEVGLVYGFAPVFDERPPPARTAARSWSVWTGGQWLRSVCQRGRNPVSTPEVVMRTSVMRALVGYDARLPHAADFLLWLRAAGVAAVGRVNGADQAFYRVHGANMHVDRYAGALTDLRQRMAAFEIFLAEDGVALPDAPRLLAAARRAVAREALTIAIQSAVDSPAGAAELAAFAAELVPSVRSARSWRRYRRAVRPPGRRVTPPGAAVAADLADRLRWRSFRRHGLFGRGWLP